MSQSGIVEEDAYVVLGELVREGRVVEGKLLPGKPGSQYRWAARWEKKAQRDRAASRRRLQAIVDSAATEPRDRLEIDCVPVLAFHNYIVNEYTPPKDKRYLVVLQCSVRRPFSSSPSHASMRRAIRLATGFDPSEDFETCPVHVVVLASTMGPVPYELEDVYPANVRSGGVKHFGAERYARVRPILAERMAQYIIAHRRNYDHSATFTDGRYAQVMEEARRIADLDFPILPARTGATVRQMGQSKPRKYWEKYWIQLYLEILSWLDAAAQAQADARLKRLEVVYS